MKLHKQSLRVLVLLAGATALWAQQGTMFPPVRGTREMVAAANNFEVEAGFRLLTQGGNAVDAGAASILLQLPNNRALGWEARCRSSSR